MPDFLLLVDLANQIGHDRIVQFFDDDADGVVVDADPNVEQVLNQAEGLYYSRMRRAYGSRQALIDLATADSIVKGHVIWLACEIAAERRMEFTSTEGWGAYKVQYERAITELDLLSKGQTRSVGGEEAVGQGANTGGRIQPKPPAGEPNQFTFATSRNRPGGSGGF
jgi:hypothetical protein